MKIPCLFLLAGFVAVASAQPVFQENFQESRYEEGAMPPSGSGKISYGSWQESYAKTFFAGIVRFEGETRCLELRIPGDYEGPKRARIGGSLGHTNEANETVMEALTMRLSLRANALLGPTFFFQLFGADGKARATIGQSENGRFTASFGGVREELDTAFEPNRWYLLELKMPAAPQTHSRYTFAIYDEETGDLLEEKSGRVSRSVDEGGTGYIGFEVVHATPGASAFVKSVTVEANP